ncbi:uncharacterized protein LOC132937984 [Metopolophium dirhodum]|uniref:uncharacterized protein LOC132937984 n=1 Tax=Metopolophium dirhodum TaxID=44670 RepID=UPI00298FB623|nr:uncharacterized protein LOC132937984 [Metopolophium dirhodum]
MAQFQLRKWASNNSQLLQTVPDEARVISPSDLFESSEHSDLKVLGLKWDPVADNFCFKAKPSAVIPTKRTVLSDIARIFDPLGLLSPTTFWTKHVMHQLWIAGVKRDEEIPKDIAVMWTRYQSELMLIEAVSIPRWITFDDATSIQLHAFSDSSEKGYAAAVYLRTTTPTSVHCHLTDSTTALAWIQSSPHRWATFVANRTSQVHELTSPDIWNHVPTHQNPVDCASRGLFPSELATHLLWWTGPAYLLESADEWPSAVNRSNTTDANISTEARKCTVLLTTTNCCYRVIIA